jgi:galactokinase
MTELGVKFEDSISMLVSSAVPEGKGVSSSASVEVASMSAIAAAHGKMLHFHNNSGRPSCLQIFDSLYCIKWI